MNNLTIWSHLSLGERCKDRVTFSQPPAAAAALFEFPFSLVRRELRVATATAKQRRPFCRFKQNSFLCNSQFVFSFSTYYLGRARAVWITRNCANKRNDPCCCKSEDFFEEKLNKVESGLWDCDRHCRHHHHQHVDVVGGGVKCKVCLLQGESFIVIVIVAALQFFV